MHTRPFVVPEDSNNLILRPELVAPAGSPEKLRVAVRYGADAVYLSGESYGLRSRAGNFSMHEIESGITFAHAHGVKVYVTLNAFLQDEDLSGVECFSRFLESHGVDGVVVSDLGVLRRVRQTSALPIHLSTQASCLNSGAALLWKELGVKRIVLGREATIKDAAAVRCKADLEVEIFVHGALCMAFGGRCLISNFTAGRDANRGGCVHTCRFRFFDAKGEQVGGAHFLSSKDLCAVDCFSKIVEAGVTGIKIEGRMRSLYYLACTCRAYRALIDGLSDQGTTEAGKEMWANNEVNSVPHRPFCAGGLKGPLTMESFYSWGGGPDTGCVSRMAGMVLERCGSDALVRLYVEIAKGQNLEVLPFRGERVNFVVDEIWSITGKRLEHARQDQAVLLPRPKQLPAWEPFQMIAAKRVDLN